MDFDPPKFKLTLWWDVIIHYLTIAMMAISLAAFGFQTAKDELVCMPVVNCSALARNQSVLWAPNTTALKLNVCSKFPGQEPIEGIRPTAVLATMVDRRQYDYVESECYSKLLYFPAFFSVIFFAEALIIVIISNFLLVYPATSFVLNQLESLCDEFLISGVLMSFPSSTMANEHTDFSKRLKRFVEMCEKKPRWHFTSVTFQYRLRVVFGFIFSLVFFTFNNIKFKWSSNDNKCHLENVLFLTEYRYEYFECSRSIAKYYNLVTHVFLVLLILNFVLFFGAFLWDLNPFVKYEKKGDAGFLFQKLKSTNSFCHIGFKRILHFGFIAPVPDIPLNEESEGSAAALEGIIDAPVLESLV